MESQPLQGEISVLCRLMLICARSQTRWESHALVQDSHEIYTWHVKGQEREKSLLKQCRRSVQD